jgi:threonine/homoserine/homoserine lactone efflux protein
MILSSGLNYGIRRSIPHWLGICTGVPLMVMAVGLGLDQLFQIWPWLFTGVKTAGILYLLYLAYKIARTRVEHSATETSKPMTYFQAASFQWVNPKAWVIILGAVTSFTTAGQSLLPQIVEIALTFLVVGLIGVGVWLFAGNFLQRLIRNPIHQQRFNWVMASLLGLSILPMAFA